MFECRVASKEYPSEGEVVVAKTLSLDDSVIKVELLEYGNLQGIVLNSELSKRRVRSIHQVTRTGNTEICQVLKVEPEKRHIDLSLKRPSEEERKICMELFSKNKVAYQIMARVAKLEQVSITDLYNAFGYQMAEKYGSLYKFFSRLKKDEQLYENLPHGEAVKRVIDEQFKASKFKVRIDIDVTSPFKGVESIKEAFRKALEGLEGTEAVLLRTPTYSITHVGTNKEEAIEIVNTAAKKVAEHITACSGKYSVAAPARIYGEKHKHSLLNDDGDEVSEEISDEEDSESSQ